MAELDAQLRLDIDQALRDINQIEGALDRALGSVELRLDSTSARRQLDDLAQQADQALDDVDIDFDAGAASRLNSELSGVERNLAGADREADQLDGSLRRAARAANDVQTSAGGLSKAFGGIGKALANVSIAAAALVAIRGAFNFAIDAKDAFAGLQDSANAVKVVFGESVGVIEEYGRVVAQSAGLSTLEFNQSASVLGSALLNVGFGADVAATKTIELTQRAADMASIFGGPVSEALGAIQSALRGETDPIERFGVSLSEAAVNAQAAALGFQTVSGEFSTSEKAAARLDIIMQQTARTSGDFANTSGDLANAQKIMAAEFENAKASIGESLLPIFQTLLDIAPEVITNIENLAPSFNAFAISLGKLLEHRAGAVDLLDVLNGLADIPRAFGALGTIFTAIGDAEGASQRFTEQINTQGLIDDLREGTDAAGALSFRLAEVGRTGKLNPAFIRDLTKIAGVDMRETIAALKEVLVQAKNFNLADDEIRNVAVALAQLQSAGESSEADRALDRAAVAARQVADNAPPAVVAFRDLQLAAADAGVEVEEFALSTDPAIAALVEALDPADRFILKMDAIRSGAITAADAFDTNLKPSIIDASDALIDFNDNGKVSMAEFIRGLEEGVAAALQFKSDLAFIFSISPEVALIIGGLAPEEAIARARELAAEPWLIPLVLAGATDPVGVAETIQDVVLQAMALVKEGASEEVVDAFVDLFTEKFPEAEDEILSAIAFMLGGAVEDAPVPDITPKITEGIRRINHARTRQEMEAALAVSFADVELPEFTHQFTQSIDAMNSGEVTAEMNAALGVSFADIDPPDFTPIFVGGIGKISSKDVNVALADEIAASFGSDDVLTAAGSAGTAAGNAFWDGVTGVKYVTPKVKTAVNEIISDAIGWKSPPKLFLDAGIASGDAFWMGFEQSDLIGTSLTQAAEQLSTVGDAVAGSFQTSFEQLEGVLPAVIQRSAETVDLTQFDDLGAAMARQLTTAVEGDFRLSPELDPLTAEQLLALNLDPITPVIGPADPLTVGQLQEMVDAANAARTVVESQLEAIQFDFELQGLQEDLAALTATTGEVGIAAREAFMAGLSASTSEEVVQLRASILDAINSATESRSPSRLMLRLGGAAGEAFWMGFEQADMSLRVPVPSMTGKISTGTAAAAADGGDAGFTFAPTYVNTETKDLETVVARSEQLMGAVSGILNGRFKL